MGKVGQVAIVVGMTIAVYLFILVIMPIMNSLASTANATMTASSNLSNYPGAASGLIAAPWGLFFAPAIISGAVIVGILRRR